MSEPAEFYVSCNPPLLPNGVEIVVADIENSLGEVCFASEVRKPLTYSLFRFLDRTGGTIRS